MLDQFNAFNIGAVRLEASLAMARSTKVKTWMEQTQVMGGGKEGRQIRVEMEALRRQCDFLEGALTQMTNFVIDLKDKQDTGGEGALRPRSSHWVASHCGRIYRHTCALSGSTLTVLLGNERGLTGVWRSQLPRPRFVRCLGAD